MKKPNIAKEKAKYSILHEKNDGLIVKIRIIPNSSRNEIIFEEEFLKIKITAQPIENKANKMLTEFLAKKLKIAKSNIQIIKGEANKEKTLFISGTNKEAFKKLIFDNIV